MATEGADQLSGVAVPNFHGAVLTSRGDPPAVGAECHGVDLPAVSPEDLGFVVGLQVPDLDRVPLTPRRQPLAVRAESHVHARPGVPVEGEPSCLLLVQPRRVPEFHCPRRLVEARCWPSGLNTTAQDFPVARRERDDLLAGPGVPDLHGAVDPSRDQVLAVGTERHRHVFRPGRKRENKLAGSRVPDLDGVPPAVGRRLAIRRPSGLPGQTRRQHRPSPLNVERILPGRRVPDLHRPGRSPPTQIRRPSGLNATLRISMRCAGEGQRVLGPRLPGAGWRPRG